MIDCELSLVLVCKDGELTLRQWVVLPFVPWKGLKIVTGRDDSGGDFEETVEEVAWCVEHGVAWVDCGVCDFAGGGCQCLPEDKCCDTSGWVEHYKMGGWEFHSVARGYNRMHGFKGIWEPDKTFSKWLKLPEPRPERPEKDELDRAGGTRDNASGPS